MALHDPSSDPPDEMPPPVGWRSLVLSFSGTPPAFWGTEKVGVSHVLRAAAILITLGGAGIWLGGLFGLVAPDTRSVAGWTALAALALGIALSILDQIRHGEARDALIHKILAVSEEQHQAAVEGSADLKAHLDAVEHTVAEESEELAAINQQIREGEVTLGQVASLTWQRQAELAAATVQLKEVRQRIMEADAKREELALVWATLPERLAQTERHAKREGRLLFALGLLMSIPIGFMINWLS